VVLAVVAAVALGGLAIGLNAATQARGRSGLDHSAQSDLTNAIISGKTIFTNRGAYPTELSTLSGLQSSEPELNFTNALVSTSGKVLAINVQVSLDGQIVLLADGSADGRCWYAEDNEEAQPGQVGGLAAAKVTTAQGISYNGTKSGVEATDCGYTDAYLGTAKAGGWGSTFPS